MKLSGLTIPFYKPLYNFRSHQKDTTPHSRYYHFMSDHSNNGVIPIEFVLLTSDGDCAHLRRGVLVLGGAPRARPVAEHRGDAAVVRRPPDLATRQQPRQLHEAGERCSV